MKNVPCRSLALILVCTTISTLALAKTNTTTTLTSSANPSTYASSVTFTATVSPSAATGTVTFKDGSTTLGTGTLSSGKATYSTSKLAAGSHSITAVYGSDTNYNGSTSSALTQTVNEATSSVTLSSSANPATYGSSVKFTATVTPSSCTGTVTFNDSSTTLGTGTLSSGKAIFSTSTLTAGSHSITGSYGGNSNCNSSTSSALTQTVNKANTTTSLSSSSNPSGYGSSVTFTATVSPTTATGTVTFKDGSTTLGTGNISSGTATYSTSSLAVGSHSITGVYSGDSNYKTSTSSKLTQTVKQASSTTVSSSTNPAPSGTPVTFTAVVTPSASTGTVTFYDSSTSIGSGPLSGGAASLTTSSLAVGSHSITAVYGGDTNYVGSTSPVLTQNIKTLSSISLSPTNVSVPVGATQQFTATGTFSDGTVGNITVSATWTSSVTTVATVSATAVATLLDEGPTTIQAAVGSVTGSTTLTGTPSRFRFTGSLITARWGFTATVLQSGKVLIAGGYGINNDVVGTCELYDPTTGTFSQTGSLAVPRFNHTATLLNNGMVLVAGGQVSDGSGGLPESASAELYDPNAGKFSLTGSLSQARKLQTATLLGSGLVLIAGGAGLSGEPAAAELYSSASGTFTPTGNLNTPRDTHTATLLNDGTVLIAGGEDGGLNALASAEIYNSSTGAFTTTGSMNTASIGQTATLLNSGKVLIAAGYNYFSGATYNRTELYDPTAKTFALSTSLSFGREDATATLLSSGQVLIVGGFQNANSQTTPLTIAELFDPTSSTVSIAGNLNNARFSHTASLLSNGLVLIAGGLDKAGFPLASAETYQSTTNEPPPASLRITPTLANIPVGGTQKFTAVDGSGSPRLDATWTVSDSTVATVTTDEDNAAIVTGIAAGQVTLTANTEGVTAQEQVTILSSSSFSAGTTTWTVPPPVAGFSVVQTVSAVPSANGPDLYSISTSSDGTQSIIQALTADGEQLWQANMPPMLNDGTPDALGGLVATTCASGQPLTVVDLDATGQPLWQLQSAAVSGYGYICYAPQFAVGGDGTTYIAEPTNAGLPSLTTVLPNGYISSIQFPTSTVILNGRTTNVNCCVGPPMVNTDGAAYVEYEVRNTNNNVITSDTLYLYNATTGSSTVLGTTTQDEALLPGPIISDGTGGILATWTVSPSHSVLQFPYQAADVTNGVVGSPYGLPFSPQSVTPFVSPALVLGQNGTVFARGSTSVTINGTLTSVDQIASFNVSSGAPNWMYQAGSGSTLSIIAAGSDGGVSISDSQNGIVHLDSNGNAWPVSGNIGGTVHSSWTGQFFSQTSQANSGLAVPIDVDPANMWPSPGGNPSGNGAPGELCGCLAQTPDTSGSAAPTGDAVSTSVQTDSTSQLQPSVPAGCDICTLAPPPATSCLTYTGTGTLSVILVGDPGQDNHNAGNLFNLAAQQKANDLRAQGGTVTACRVATIQDVINVLSNSGLITGVVHYFGHSGIYRVTTNGIVTTQTERIFVGETSAVNTNITVGNVASLSVVQPLLSTNTAIWINGCNAGLTEWDTDYNSQEHQSISIAQLISTNVNRGVYAYAAGIYFSHVDAADDPYYNGQDPSHPGKARLMSEVLPMYLVPEGSPGAKPPFFPFCPGGMCSQH